MREINWYVITYRERGGTVTLYLRTLTERTEALIRLRRSGRTASTRTETLKLG